MKIMLFLLSLLALPVFLISASADSTSSSLINASGNSFQKLVNCCYPNITNIGVNLMITYPDQANWSYAPVCHNNTVITGISWSGNDGGCSPVETTFSGQIQNSTCYWLPAPCPSAPPG